MSPSGHRCADCVGESSAVLDTVTRYAKLIDRRRWADYRALFEDELELHYPEFTDGPRGRATADEWVDIVRASVSGFTATQHNLSTPVVEFEDCSHASVDVNLVARHILTLDGTTEILTVAGFYDFGLAKRDGQWRIASSRLTSTWDEGDRNLFERAHPFAEIPMPVPRTNQLSG